MKDVSRVKENIIRATTELIEQSSGRIHEITSRKIAQQAGVGLGLINYHFGSKENLITICVQRIINNVVMCFSQKKDTADRSNLSDEERLADWAKQVFDFLFENHAISSISILGDMQNYHIESNSVYTQKGFLKAIQNQEMPEGDKRLLVFMLTGAMQIAFLSGDTAKELLGYDLTIKEQRDLYIEKTVNILFAGVNGKGGESHE